MDYGLRLISGKRGGGDSYYFYLRTNALRHKRTVQNAIMNQLTTKNGLASTWMIGYYR